MLSSERSKQTNRLKTEVGIRRLNNAGEDFRSAEVAFYKRLLCTDSANRESRAVAPLKAATVTHDKIVPTFIINYPDSPDRRFLNKSMLAAVIYGLPG